MRFGIFMALITIAEQIAKSYGGSLLFDIEQQKVLFFIIVLCLAQDIVWFFKKG